MLGKTELVKYIEEGKIVFSPQLDEFQIQPNSIDLRIGTSFYLPESWKLTDAGRVAVQPDYLTKEFNQDYLKLIKLKAGQYFEVLPQESVLISSFEKVEFRSRDISAVLYPRSSIVRRGFVTQGGIVDVGYKGHLLIPVQNSTNHSLRLYPGERAYQLLFHFLASELSEADAAKHGVDHAKYDNATAVNLEARTDNEEEIAFIKKGDIDGLKAKFPFKKV
jgi:deoxycytidine triphosphate deaminase